MIPLFLGLTSVNLLCLIVTAALGYATTGGARVAEWHVLAGALSAITCCAVHCVVFTYFIATAKWIQHAVSVKNLDPELTRPTRSFKVQAMPAAMTAIAAVLAAAILGAYTDSYQRPSTLHHIAAITSIAINALVACVEYSAISRNGKLVDEVLAKIAAQQKQG
jgi:hypothetical protein